MSKINPETIEFLKELRDNNNREWFLKNKPGYDRAMDNFKDFIDALIPRIGIFDPSVMHITAKDAVFRIYRDVRFSKDKSPYKSHLGAHITSAAKKSEIHSKAGYYIHIEPGQSLLGGGAYLPQGPWLKAIRQEIHFNAPVLKGILDSKDFKKYFGAMEGEKLKTTPKDYPADHPEIELLKHKSFLASQSLSDGEITAHGFLEHCAKAFEALFPFDTFLNNAVA
jgi:uncharacterized protein (TIGR02453 family)